MAQLVLSRAGAALGSRLAPQAFQAIGTAIGQAAGSYIGGRIDDAVFGPQRRFEGPRLTDLHIQGSTEGASVPATFGRVRMAGQVIWAARFKEHVSTERVGGGKGGGSAKVTNYSYSLSFAVGLCEGEVSRISRMWANGEPFDPSSITWRLHQGTEDQSPDALIEAIEGAENAPSYRGLAYVVFEDLPLENFGNVMPQLSFELVRPSPPIGSAPRLEDMVRGVCLIPGAGEFVYATDAMRRVSDYGLEAFENVHAEADRANLLVSLDQLEADLPHCSSVMLVVAWFGTDLRCAECEIRPCVEIAEKINRPATWRVNDVEREDARVVSEIDGAPAFGGTPSDHAVVQAIAELKARGLSVGLYPFVMMDVPPGNGLDDPYDGAEQAAFPWRGRITCHPAPGVSGSPDKTDAAGDQVETFFGTADAADFSVSGTTVNYSGPNEWSFRRFILHYAKLAQAAGGVDAFLLGSELRGLTTVRDGAANYPAVAALKNLASDVRAVLGGGTTLSYAADWSEYFSHQPQDGSHDVFFHLDPLWADSAIDVVAVDWYAPLTDWREGAVHVDAALANHPHDLSYLQSRIEAGEDYDWFYADDDDREAQTRTPITDGAYTKPWVFRAKDLRSWWANAHYNRPGGVESGSPTAWTAQSKPIWLVELGVPAVDKGANSPNLFYDAKSSESALPPYSTGARDDLIQRRALEAYLNYWGADEINPISSVYDGPMIDPAGLHLWAWDARPHPYFPARSDLWADAASWRLGHWLNGRAGAATLGEVVMHLCARAGVTDVDVSGLSGVVSGYVVDGPSAPRAALEPLMAVYDFDVSERDGVLVFAHRGESAITTLALEDLAQGDADRAAITRADGADAPVEARVRFLDAARDHRLCAVSARQRDAAGAGVATLEAPLTLDPDAAEGVARRLLATAVAETEMLAVALPPSLMAIEPGDRIAFEGLGVDATFRVAGVEESLARNVALAPEIAAHSRLLTVIEPEAPVPPVTRSAPDLLILDLPPLPGFEDDDRPLVAVRAYPWTSTHDVLAGPAANTASLRGVAEHPAITGVLSWDLYSGPLCRWDDGNVVRVTLNGSVESASADDVLNGANVFAVEGEDGWEIIQARNAVLVAPNTYDLSGLLRGLQGTDGAMGQPTPAGSRIVKLDERLTRLNVRAHEIGAELTWGAVASGRTLDDPSAATVLATWSRAWARPFSPTHVRGRRVSGGDVEISWVRRGRLGGENWSGTDVALSEETEAYRLEILDGGDVVRTFEVSTPVATYPSAQQTADFGSPPASLTVRAAQISATFGAGTPRESTIWL